MLTFHKLRKLCVYAFTFIISFLAPASQADYETISMVCTAVESRGFSWNRERGQFEKAEFNKRTYMVTSAENDEVSCMDSEAICLHWRNTKETKDTYRFLFSCYVSSENTENERLHCSLGRDESLTIDVKRGVYTFAKNTGPAIYGRLAEVTGADPKLGTANSMYVEHGVCNKL